MAARIPERCRTAASGASTARASGSSGTSGNRSSPADRRAILVPAGRQTRWLAASSRRPARRQPAGEPSRYRPPRRPPGVPWADLPLNGHPDSPLINFIQFRIVKDGEVTYQNAWVTDLGTHQRQHRRTGACRAGTLEDRERRVQHPQEPRLPPGALTSATATSTCRRRSSCSTCWRSSCTRSLTWSIRLYQRVRTFFSSRRAFWDEVRVAFRLFLFISWDQVLARMNSPPQPLPRISLGSPCTRCLHAACCYRTPEHRAANFAGWIRCYVPIPRRQPRAAGVDHGVRLSGDWRALPKCPLASTWAASLPSVASPRAPTPAHRELLGAVSVACPARRSGV